MRRNTYQKSKAPKKQKGELIGGDYYFYIQLMSHPAIDIEEIARQSIQPVQAFLAPNLLSKVDKKQRLQWRPEFQLIDFGIPVNVYSPAIKKKFKIVVQCLDKAHNKSFSKTIFFGQQSDYIFNGDKTLRLKRLTSLKNKNNPLHADYWRAHLCLSTQDFKANCKKMMDFLIQKRFSSDQPKIKPQDNQSNPSKKKQT